MTIRRVLQAALALGILATGADYLDRGTMAQQDCNNSLCACLSSSTLHDLAFNGDLSVTDRSYSLADGCCGQSEPATCVFKQCSMVIRVGVANLGANPIDLTFYDEQADDRSSVFTLNPLNAFAHIFNGGAGNLLSCNGTRSFFVEEFGLPPTAQYRIDMHCTDCLL